MSKWVRSALLGASVLAGRKLRCRGRPESAAKHAEAAKHLGIGRDGQARGNRRLGHRHPP